MSSIRGRRRLKEENGILALEKRALYYFLDLENRIRINLTIYLSVIYSNSIRAVLRDQSHPCKKGIISSTNRTVH